MDNNGHFQVSPQIIKLRNFMIENEIDVFVVFMGDSHNSEFPSEHDKRIEFLCGFPGSFGTLVITQSDLLLWTDGRYFVVAERFLQPEWTIMKMGVQGFPTIKEYLDSIKFQTLGIDSHSTTLEDYLRLTDYISPFQQIKPVTSHVVDEIWGEKQPAKEAHPVYIHPIEFSGQPPHEKLTKLREKMSMLKVDGHIINLLDDIAWLTNLRGKDIPYNPLFYSFMVVTHNTAKIYFLCDKISPGIITHLNENQITTGKYDDFEKDLKGYQKQLGTKKVLIDPRMTLTYAQIFPQENQMIKNGPIAMLKAVKNQAEIEAMKEAHLIDAVALTKFYCWVDDIKKDKTIFDMNELDLSNKIDTLRSQQEGFLSLVCSTVCGIGANSAIPHYTYPKTEKDDIGMKPMMFLVDGGAQYVNGTTDITRTVHLGTPTDFEKLCYTLVLKGHIALSTLVFPEGTTGPQVDIISRQFLSKYGLHFFHGTGHGVGAALCVHEGPMKIDGKMMEPFISTPLLPGMIVSNEPGYYDSQNEFGIRIENLVVVKEAQTPFKNELKKFFSFENISFAAIDTEMVDLSLLNRTEVDWINDYHKEVFDKISPRLQAEDGLTDCNVQHVLNWLKNKTAPIISQYC